MSKTDNKTESVEAKMVRLREMVAWFESDEFNIEQASTRFSQAAELAKEIEDDLSSLKNEINLVKQSFEK